MRAVCCRVLLAVSIAAPTVTAAEQADRTATFRLFLQDGSALPVHGDYAVTDDRVIFMLVVGRNATADDAPALHLMSLPLSAVDVDRSARYARAVRAAYYAQAWGESDFAAITAEVQASVAYLARVADPGRRIVLAESARERLLAWSRDHFDYRSADIQRLAALFDDVIAELRVAAGASRFAFDLVAGPPPLAPEPLLPPSDAASIARHALAAARAADVGADRLAVLRAALVALPEAPEMADLRRELSAEVDAERQAGEAYTALEERLVALGAEPMRAGDPAGLDLLIDRLEREDAALGRRRPAAVRRLMSRLLAMRDRARTYRVALDRYAAARAGLLAYERRVRRSMSTLDGQNDVLEAIRDDGRLSMSVLDRALDRLSTAGDALAAVEAPDEVADVHATLVSAVRMARQACEERRLAVATTAAARARTASSAAAGAILLSASARETLVRRLFPPEFD